MCLDSTLDFCRPATWTIVFTLLAVLGCNEQPKPTPAPVTPTSTSAVESTPETNPQPSAPPKPKGGEFLKRAADALANGKPDDARAALEELRQLKELTEDERQQLSKFDAQLATMLETENAAAREAALLRIPQLMANGQLDEATTAVETVASRQPTDEQREQLAKHRQEIERIRGAQRKLGAWMKLIGSKNRSEFRAAQDKLIDEPEAATPLLIAALNEPGDKQRMTNILETLRQLKKPEVTLPAMVGLLSKSDQQENWPTVIDTLSRISDPGAGVPLLKLLSDSGDEKQRAAALSALAKVPDPPTETLLALLPKLYQDNSELSTALACVAQSVRLHHQNDLTALRGIPANASAEQLQQLTGLPARLEALRSTADPEVARGAKLLSVALGLVTPEPLTGLTIANVSGEYPEGPAAAALDGVWNSTDLKSIWYHPIELESQITLDLGTEKTVTGVILWNFNQAGGSYRGWKRAEVFVSSTPTALTPIASGVVPMAPGVNEPADYGVFISVPCATGRYVKLKAAEIWNRNAYTGLSEIQILGF